ncbi:uncharacterized protein JN550_013214 [Neoarthrinium moseri]|uniref:uncharacterized protein n=1 Tax=Neoarthrinium moseri TaxID=1658444 RepID=UPI001FDCCA0A|nr:uncharacterized protein JN550_013214 [Neoarthrinium moseri]KAI1857396.1 hypothetical protein JN550_013214 [Neoarthrinium moseri]
MQPMEGRERTGCVFWEPESCRPPSSTVQTTLTWTEQRMKAWDGTAHNELPQRGSRCIGLLVGQRRIDENRAPALSSTRPQLGPSSRVEHGGACKCDAMNGLAPNSDPMLGSEAAALTANGPDGPPPDPHPAKRIAGLAQH